MIPDAWSMPVPSIGSREPTVKPLQVKLIPPRSPIIAGKRIEFKCQSLGSRPRPKISWFKGDTQPLALTEVLESHSSDSNTTISTVSFVPSVGDDGQHLSCRTENPLISGSTMQQQIRLHVTCESLARSPGVHGDELTGPPSILVTISERNARILSRLNPANQSFRPSCSHVSHVHLMRVRAIQQIANPGVDVFGVCLCLRRL